MRKHDGPDLDPVLARRETFQVTAGEVVFNGKDLQGWKVPVGDNGHWKVIDGVIDYDHAMQITGDQPLPKQYIAFAVGGPDD